MDENRRFDRAGSVSTSRSPRSIHTNPDVPIRSIESDNYSPAGSSDTSATISSGPVIRTPSTSTSPQLSSATQQSPSIRANNSQSRELTSASNQSGTSSMGQALGRMHLSDRVGLENLSDVAAAVEGVARGSDSRAASLAPEDNAPSRQGTPRRSRRDRRSGSRALLMRHDVRDEELPRDAFHDPSFQQAFRDAKELMGKTQSVLGSASIHQDPDSTMRRLHTEAGELARFMYPSTRTVGFVGDSGVGKSSLLNSLLDCKGLARTSNSGEACTCVVTEYHYHGRDTLDIEVELFSLDEINDQLVRMLESYRYFHLNQEDLDPSERSDREKSATQARDTFRSMFGGRMNNEDFLLDGPQSRVLESLMSWASAARPSQISSRQSNLSLGSCSNSLMELSSEPSSRTDPAKWPFIKKIKVFLNAHILSKGLILVDLPGLRDLNSARRGITERFLLKCDEIFVICNIGRAVTDEGVQCVFQLARRAELSNVGIICTKSDDIQADEAIRDWKGKRAKHIKRLQDLIASDGRELVQIKADIAEYDLEDDEDELLDEEKDELNDLYRRQTDTNNRIKNREQELHAYLITTRNSDVQQELQNQYSHEVTTGEIKVFCVSNIKYWKYRDMTRDVALPMLRLSGILAVRRYCISIVANSQRRIATRYMKDDIPALLAQIELWVQSGAGSAGAERKEAIRSTLTALQDRLARDLSHHTSSINRISRVLRDDFRAQIYNRRNISDWSGSAIDAGYEWGGWHHSTYSAFCRNYGNHCTGAVGSHNWNEEAIEGMVTDLRGPWRDLREVVGTRPDNIEELLDELTEWSIDHLENNLSEMPEITTPLVNALISQKDLLWSNIEQISEIFGAGLKTLRTDALSGLQTSLIGKAMESGYRSCNRESGRGSDARRKGIINRTLGNEDLFVNLMRDFKTIFKQLADEVQENTQTAVADYLESVNTTLDIILDDNVALESEQDPEFRRRVGDNVRESNAGIVRIKAVISSV